MAPQQTDVPDVDSRPTAETVNNVTTVELPDVTHTLSPDPVMYENNWVFPEGWSDEDKRDWLVTHPTGVETITIADEDGTPYEGLTEAEADQLHDELNEAADEQEASEREVISALKADGYYAAAIAVPPDQQDTVNSDNYDPRQFFLVHSEVWNEFVSAVHREAELGLENKELRKRVNALTRGMRKVNRHWSATKSLLKREAKLRAEDNKWWSNHDIAQCGRHAEEMKREKIFATRLARRLRKARAGRDKRERQLNQAQMTIKAQDHIIEKQDEYISHLEKLMTGDPQVSAAWRSTL